MSGNTLPGECENNWWHCVYLPKRLVILESCVTVRGIVVDARYVLDGDAILYLRLDPEYAHFSNQKNYEQFGNDILELEIVCRHPVFRFLVFRCWTCGNKILVPRVGDHIEADGVYVEDTRHMHLELHPVTRITMLRSAKVGEAHDADEADPQARVHPPEGLRDADVGGREHVGEIQAAARASTTRLPGTRAASGANRAGFQKERISRLAS